MGADRRNHSPARLDPESEHLAARVAAADRLRALGDALVARRAPVDVLQSIAEVADELLAAVVKTPKRVHPIVELLARPDAQEAFARGDLARLLGDEMPTLFVDSIVSGSANPRSVPVKYNLDGDDLVARFTLGRAFEGAPGRAHGGTLAAIVDEAMGTALHLVGVLGFTKVLEVTYRAPAPIETPLEIRARVQDQNGRKHRVTATGTTKDTMFLEAEAIFIASALTTPPLAGDTRIQ